MPKIIGIGHAMCDINVELESDAWDSLNDRLHWENTRSPLHVSSDYARDIVAFISCSIKDKNNISHNAGGSALNAVRVASRLGIETALLGSIGEDAYGAIVRDGLRKSGVRDWLSIHTEEGDATGVFCTVRHGGQMEGTAGSEKIVIASPASARKIRALNVEALNLSGASFLHTEGLLADAPQFFERLLQKCKRERIGVSIDLVSAEFVRKNREALISAMRCYVDIVFCNKREFEALDCKMGALGREMTWVLKADRDGVDCYFEGKSYHIGAPRCKVIDDTGAGDAFAGAFLAGHIEGRDISNCLEIATSSAACALSTLGPEPERRCLESLHHDFLAD